jgi:hypothetical protein
MTTNGNDNDNNSSNNNSSNSNNNNSNNKPPAVPGKNPFEDFADRADNQMLLGPILKFTKGDWVIGRDGEECPEKEMVALLPGLMHGWIRWEDNCPVEHIMGLLMEGFVPPALETLSQRDKTQWPLDSNNKPRDPWQDSAYLPMISVNAENVYTFATSSDGGRRRALAPLCRDYGSHIRQHPDELPVVGLEQDSYQHPDRTIGRVKYPLLPIKRYVKAKPYIVAVTTLTGKSLKLLPPGKAA